MAEEDSKNKMSCEMGSGSTVESLRGRLLAERQASRVANEEAELLDNKLRQLEKKLKEEAKLRGKAEKKLKFLMKKLNKISSPLMEQELCGLISESSSSSTVTTSASAPKDPEEEEEEAESKPAPISWHWKIADDDQSSSSSRNEVEEGSSNGSVDNSMALVPAAVCVAAAAVTKSSNESGELKLSGKDVGEVLEALRHARAKIEMSMGRRGSCY